MTTIEGTAEPESGPLQFGANAPGVHLTAGRAADLARGLRPLADWLFEHWPDQIVGPGGFGDREVFGAGMLQGLVSWLDDAAREGPT